MNGFDDIFYQSSDGLTLHARDYRQAPPTSMPLLCLPGLTRNARDFAGLTARLAPRHRLIVAEQRGRGQSAYDPNPENYTPPVYVADMLMLLDHLGLKQVAVIGTSLGGIMAMLLAAQQPARLAGILFNDIGPAIELDGLARIRGYIDRVPQVATWDDAAADLKGVFGAAFPRYQAADWQRFAAAVYRENKHGAPVLDHDPLISVMVKRGPLEAPDLWPLWDALPDIPLAVVRGQLSNLLSEATVTEMTRRRPALLSVDLPDIGHAPTLEEPLAVALIERFLALI